VNAYAPLAQLFLQHLAAYQSSLTGRQPTQLYAPCDYILSLGGKRLRPLLALAACDLFGKKPQQALNAALAVELFHNFSLIHDDILDKAPLRRNKPTVHVKWSPQIALLSGDVLLVEAGRALEHYAPARYKQLATLFNRTATEVCDGQQLDMNFETQHAVSTAEYIRMIELKTAVLLGCSLQMGAICASAPAAAQRQLYEFGRNLGIAFQLLDDYLDAFAGNSGKFGKQVGGDIVANKQTFLLIKTRELASAQQKRALARLMNTKNTAEKVNGVLQLMRQLGVDGLCLAEAEKYTATALRALNKVKAPAAKKAALKTFAQSLMHRQA